MEKVTPRKMVALSMLNKRDAQLVANYINEWAAACVFDFVASNASLPEDEFETMARAYFDEVTAMAHERVKQTGRSWDDGDQIMIEGLWRASWRRYREIGGRVGRA